VNFINEAVFQNLVTGTKPVLANKIPALLQLFPKKQEIFHQVYCVAPITLNGCIIGSINHGMRQHTLRTGHGHHIAGTTDRGRIIVPGRLLTQRAKE